MEFLKFLANKNFTINLVSYSAIDKYLYENKNSNYLYVYSDATIIDVAKFTDKIETGFLNSDFAVNVDDKIYLFYSNLNFDFPVLYFFYNLNRKVFKNNYESFNHIKRKETFFCRNKLSLKSIIDGAIIVARYNFKIKKMPQLNYDKIFTPLSSNEQKRILVSILEGDFPYNGLNFLLKKGFIEFYWKEIYEMTKVEQIKDYHPEGNVWDHTLETFKYLKKRDITVALALLFHDIGKAYSHEFNGKKFYKHAQIGSKIAEKFLKKLNFSDEIIKKVKILVKYHMLPSAILDFPENKLKKLKNKIDFNKLFELYRADILSSYKKLDIYLETKKYLKKF